MRKPKRLNFGPTAVRAGLPRRQPETNSLFLKIAFTETRATAQIGTSGQCYGGCGRRYHREDRYCDTSSGTTTRCAVRFDWVSCNQGDPYETGVRILYDRCVNRDT